MLGLTIDSIVIEATTSGGIFSAEIPLGKGLNIIRAENSSGKSTTVNAIAYGLGIEKILGPQSKRPFPKSLYDEILDSKEEENSHFVSSSFVSLEFTNSQGLKAATKRDVLGDTSKITVTSEGKVKDYFLGTSGNVGSAKSERGFHYWLTNFIGWKLPDVVTFEGNVTKLYLECIFPLFFIEQKRGWSEIQANLPSYGIKSVKKSAIEFCLGIDSFEYERKATQLKKNIERAEAEWDQLRSSAEGIADFNSVVLNNVPDVKNYQDRFAIEFLYQDADATYSVGERERSLKKHIKQLQVNISTATPDSTRLRNQQSVLRKLSREIEKNSNDMDVTILSVSDMDGKLRSLKSELDRYQQLRRLKLVGSSIEAELDTRKCPICESDLYDTLGNRSVKREPMTLQENIEFLKSQTDFYRNIRVRTSDRLSTLQSQSKLLATRFERESDLLKDLREDLDDINGEARTLLREKIQLEISLKETVKLGSALNGLKEQAERIYASWEFNNEALKHLRKQSSGHNRKLVIRELLSLLKGNLTDFNFTPASIGLIGISEQSLRPEQEGYDIVAETSASDYIRIIWAYTLALLQLAGKRDDVLHGGFVVFDEPRQHEASYESYANLIRVASEASSYDGQIIFATSFKRNELEKACEGKEVNLRCFDDYIISLDEPKLESNLDTDTDTDTDTDNQQR